jgi:chemotaxis response regulator CheB
MSTKRVLLVESGHFLGGVISSLFSHYEHLSIIEITPANGAELVKAVKKYTPQIVVLDDTLNDDFLRRLLRYMQSTEGLRVVVVGADSNNVEVYQKEQVPLQRTADFFALL